MTDFRSPDFWAPYWDSGLVETALYYVPHLRAMPANLTDISGTVLPLLGAVGLAWVTLVYASGFAHW